MALKNIVLYPDRNGHFSEYAAILLSVLQNDAHATTLFSWREFFFSNIYIVVHGDGKYLLLSLLACIRNIFKRKTYFLSVKTESFIEKSIYGAIKRGLVSIIRMQKNTMFISIHKNNRDVMEKINCGYIWDPQLWDLKLFSYKPMVPVELAMKIDSVLGLREQRPVLLVPGVLNAKRCMDDLLHNVEQLSKYFTVIFAGKSNGKLNALVCNNNIIVIDRYISNDELLYLYKVSDIIYAYYDLEVNRPSGIFGRALQLNKITVIRSDGFLDRTYGRYNKAIKIGSLNACMIKDAYDELMSLPSSNEFDVHQYDDYDLLVKLIRGNSLDCN